LNEKDRENYFTKLKESVWTAIELSKTGYLHIMQMPYMDFQEYLKWKVKYDEQVAKLKEEQLEKINQEARTKLKHLDSNLKIPHK
jgi:hypothetical protein